MRQGSATMHERAAECGDRNLDSPWPDAAALGSRLAAFARAACEMHIDAMRRPQARDAAPDDTGIDVPSLTSILGVNP